MFGVKFKELREDFNYTQQEVANILNTTRQAVSSWETVNKEPSYDMLVKVANLFNVSVDYLLGRSSVKINPTIELRDKDLKKVLNLLHLNNHLSKLIIDILNSCNKYLKINKN